MLARPKLVDGTSARNYFENDTYYINNEFEQGFFYGKLKDELGLKEFNLKDFDAILKAEHPKTKESFLKLAQKDLDKYGQRKRAACDLTFATGKDVSICYESADEKGKAEIREAFTKSINVALDFAEANYSFAKDRDSKCGAKAQSKMLFTRFDHSESRNNDMHLHQHVLAMNFVQDENGNWKSIEFNQIMNNHHLIGQIQRNEFAKELQKLGYEVEVTDAKNGFFKLKNVDRELVEKFSTRAQNIKDEMAKSGQKSYKASHTAQKQTAKWKDKNKDRLAIQEENIQRLIDAGADLESIQHKNENLHVREMKPQGAARIAFHDITDKKSVFKREDILKHALKLSLTTNVTLEAIEKEFVQFDDLIKLDENQYTTKEIIEKEVYIFSKNDAQNFKITDKQNIINVSIQDFEKKNNFTLKQAQDDLVQTILTSNKQFIVAQGVAGSGKSTSLEIVREVSEKTNRRIIAIAPTGTATENLAKEAGIQENYTVAKFLKENGSDIKDALVIVDEAGMMGLRDTYELLRLAEQNNLKIVFSGDKNQKKSIAQGDIFTAMQRQGFKTINLTEGNRQKSEIMREAVASILDRDIATGLNILKDTTREIQDPNERLETAKAEYLKDKDNSLLITTTNSDRRTLNQMIREELISNGNVIDSHEFNTREMPSMSELEKRSALYYQENEKVFLSKNIGSISAGREAVVKKVDIESNMLTIEHVGKNKTFTEIVDLTEDGEKLNLFKEAKAEFGIGDLVIAKKNDTKLGISNGQIGKITAINEEQITLSINDKEVQFTTKQYPYVQHAYAITDFASQGKTTDKVIAVANSQCASFNDFYTQLTRARYEAHIITDDLQELQRRAKQDSVKLNASEILKALEKQEQKPNKREELLTMKREIKRLNAVEFNLLAKRTKDELRLTDPRGVLDALGIEHKSKNNRYEFKIRNEKTASANMYIGKNGEWKYKDFAGGNGTIENLVMEASGSNYKEALEYAIAHSGVTDYVRERLHELNGGLRAKQPSLSIEVKRQENRKKLEAETTSKVTGTADVFTYKPAVEYLKLRGIEKIPPEFKIINGEYTNAKGEIKRAFGVGVMTEGGGADIHFLRKLGNLKTMSLGNKNISYFKSETPTKKVAVFESKMDYASAYQNTDFSNTDVVIANSTGNVHKASEAIKDKYKSVVFYNQNDQAGKDFVANVAEKANIQKYSYIEYQTDEEKLDINDLLSKGVNIAQRVRTYQKTKEQRMELTIFQQAVQAVKNKDEQAKVLFGEERVATAKECVGFFKEKAEMINDVTDEEVKSESIFEKIKVVVKNGYRMTKEWLNKFEQDEKIQMENSHENER